MCYYYVKQVKFKILSFNVCTSMSHILNLSQVNSWTYLFQYQKNLFVRLQNISDKLWLIQILHTEVWPEPVINIISNICFPVGLCPDCMQRAENILWSGETEINELKVSIHSVFESIFGSAGKSFLSFILRNNSVFAHRVNSDNWIYFRKNQISFPKTGMAHGPFLAPKFF